MGQGARAPVGGVAENCRRKQQARLPVLTQALCRHLLETRSVSQRLQRERPSSPSPRQEKVPSGKVQSCQTRPLLSFPEVNRGSRLWHRAPRSQEHTPGHGGRVGLVINALCRREGQSGPFSWSLVASASHQLCRNGEMFLKEENNPESASQRKVSSKKVCACCKALSLSPPARLKAYPVPPWDF